MLYQLKQELVQLFNGIDTDGSEDLFFRGYPLSQGLTMLQIVFYN